MVANALKPMYSYYQRHAGKTFIVAGVGPSLKGFVPPKGVVTIGVNDIHEHPNASFVPDYLWIVDRTSSFVPERLERMKRYPNPTFTFLRFEASWKKVFPKTVLCPLAKARKSQLLEWIDPTGNMPQVHHIGAGAPYGGVSLAGFMGAKKIGLIGADFTDHPSFHKQLDEVRLRWSELTSFLRGKDIDIVTLSKESALNSPDVMEYQSADEFAGRPSASAL